MSRIPAQLDDTLPAELTAADRVLAVVAHPDDESFGLGAVIARVVDEGTPVDVLCFTRGEASTLGATADLGRVRTEELARASTTLGVRHIELLDYPDRGLDAVPVDELAAHVTTLLGDDCATLLVIDRDGVTGHADHRAATAAAFAAARHRDLPVVEWGLPPVVASALRSELGGRFAALDDGDGVRTITVRRDRQREAIACHVSQLVGNPVVERRLALQEGYERLRVTPPPRD